MNTDQSTTLFTVDVREIRRTCYCPLRTRPGQYCGASSKFRMHVEDGTGEYRYACRIHLRHVKASFPRGEEVVTYTMEHSNIHSHATLRLLVDDAPSQSSSSQEQHPPEERVQDHDMHDDDAPSSPRTPLSTTVPIFLFTNPTTDYGSMFVTPPASPMRTPPDAPPPPPPRLQRANAGPYYYGDYEIPPPPPPPTLRRTDGPFDAIPVIYREDRTLLDRLNEAAAAWSPTFNHRQSPSPTQPPTLEDVNSMVVRMIRHQGGVKLKKSSSSMSNKNTTSNGDSDGGGYHRAVCTTECSICLTNDVEHGVTGGVLRCGHTFHNRCISEWFVRGKFSCPCCRASADVLDLLK